ncbi:MAG: GNAT family N-acetyltransferase [Solirubrobacterales bacterium]
MAVDKLFEGGRDSAVGTLAEAFSTDPLWSWMLELAPSDAMPRVMSLLVDGGLVNESIWETGSCDALQIWVPQGRPELTPDQEHRLTQLIESFGSETAHRMLPTFGVFEEARHTNPPHNYLSMFATRAALKGQGVGGTVMRAALEQLDREGISAYLESSNPANVPLYEHFGFEVIGYLPLAQGTPPVRNMWRPAPS